MAVGRIAISKRVPVASTIPRGHMSASTSQNCDQADKLRALATESKGHRMLIQRGIRMLTGQGYFWFATGCVERSLPAQPDRINGGHRKQLNEHRRTRTPSNLFKSLDFRSGPSCVQDAGQRKQGVWKNPNPPHFRRFFDEPLAAADWWTCKANPVENKPLSNLIGLGARPMGQQETYLRE